MKYLFSNVKNIDKNLISEWYNTSIWSNYTEHILKLLDEIFLNKIITLDDITLNIDNLYYDIPYTSINCIDTYTVQWKIRFIKNYQKSVKYEKIINDYMNQYVGQSVFIMR